MKFKNQIKNISKFGQILVKSPHRNFQQLSSDFPIKNMKVTRQQFLISIPNLVSLSHQHWFNNLTISTKSLQKLFWKSEWKSLSDSCLSKFKHFLIQGESWIGIYINYIGNRRSCDTKNIYRCVSCIYILYHLYVSCSLCWQHKCLSGWC